MSKLNPRLDQLQALEYKFQELSVKINSINEAVQSDIRLKFNSKMPVYQHEQVVCLDCKSRDAIFESRKTELLNMIEIAEQLLKDMGGHYEHKTQSLIG